MNTATRRLGMACTAIVLATALTACRGAATIKLAVTYTEQDALKAKLGNTLRMLEGGHSLTPLESQGVFKAALEPEGDSGRLVFCFPGQGTHYIGMGRHLYDSHPIFRTTVDDVATAVRQRFDFDLIGHIYGDPEDAAIRQRLGTLVGAQTALGEETFNSAWEQGKAMDLNEALAYALEVMEAVQSPD